MVRCVDGPGIELDTECALAATEVLDGHDDCGPLHRRGPAILGGGQAERRSHRANERPDGRCHELLGGMMGADMECGAGVMQHELAQHLGVACTARDMTANGAEAARRSDAMHEFADHMRMRADEMGMMTGANGGMMSGGMGLAMLDGGWSMPAGQGNGRPGEVVAAAIAIRGAARCSSGAWRVRHFEVEDAREAEAPPGVRPRSTSRR